MQRWYHLAVGDLRMRTARAMQLYPLSMLIYISSYMSSILFWIEARFAIFDTDSPPPPSRRMLFVSGASANFCDGPLQFFTFSCPFCPCAWSKPKISPQAAMDGGIGSLNVALESVTRARVGVLSQTPNDRSQFLNFFRFRACYEVVPLIQHPALGHPEQAISTVLQTESRTP